MAEPKKKSGGGNNVVKFDPSVIGNTGLKKQGGVISEEWHRRLQGDQAAKVFAEMRDNDAVVGAIIYAIESQIRKIEWKVEPAEPNNAAADEQAAFVRGCMNDMSHTWDDFICEVLSMLVYGWSFFEIVYKRREGMAAKQGRSRFEDGKVGWRKFSIRGQETLLRWEFDEEEGIEGMTQRLPGGEQATIPMEKSLLFRTKIVRNSPEGRSMLRNAYRSWYFLRRIQEIEAIGIERDLAGLPVMEVPPEIMDPNAPSNMKTLRATLEKLVQEVRRDEREGMLIPAEATRDGVTGYRFRLVSTGGARNITTDAIIRRYENRIATSVLAEFILLGTSSTGSFALASVKNDVFTLALSGIVESIQGVINRFAVHRLMLLNDVPRELWPKVTHGEIKAPPLTDVASYVARLISQEAITPDATLERSLRNVAALPPREGDTAEREDEGRGKTSAAQGAPQKTQTAPTERTQPGAGTEES